MTRRHVKRGLFALGFLFSGWLLLGWWSAAEIVRPSRRTLEPHHRDFLEHPEAHAMRLRAFESDDHTPCLLCEPLPGAGLAERGARLTTELARLHGIQAPPHGTILGTIVLLHGRHGRKEDNLPIAERFCAAGFRCILPDLPGHGDHPAALALYGLAENHIPSTALATAGRRFGFAPHPSGLWGISMGGSVAVHACAAAPSEWDALVIVASFDRLEPVIQRQADEWLGPWFGPVLFIGTERWFQVLSGGHRLSDIAPVTQAASLHLPVLIAHGTDDPLIPAEAAHQLYDAIPGTQKRLVNVGAGTHGNVLITPQPLYAEMAAWFVRSMSGPSQPKAAR